MRPVRKGNESFGLVVLTGLSLLLWHSPVAAKRPSPPSPTPTAIPGPSPTPVARSFTDSFDVDGVLEEASSMSQSASPDWWLNSGARFIRSGGVGRTLQGELPADDAWRLLYAQANPVDTDDGYHPQNIFRLVTRLRFRNLDQQARFRVTRINLSASPNRNDSNGLFFFNRYQDSETIYYTGVRADGAAVIKRKLAGNYTTLAYRGIFPGFGSYDRDTNPNLLPMDQWLGMRTIVTTNPDATVDIQLLVDQGAGWTAMLSAVDTGAGKRRTIISSDGYAGMRTDFLDAEFDDYRVSER